MKLIFDNYCDKNFKKDNIYEFNYENYILVI